MYLPVSITAAIFIGGMIRWFTDVLRKRAQCNSAQSARVENVGVLVASGLIAGEALAGLVTGWFNYKYGKLPAAFDPTEGFLGHSNPSYLVGVGVLVLIGWMLIRIPLANAGDPNEPAPPVAIM
jgi:hypothetical protein